MSVPEKPGSNALLQKISQLRMRISMLEHEKQISTIELRAYEDAAKMIFGAEAFGKMGGVLGYQPPSGVLNPDVLATFATKKPRDPVTDMDLDKEFADLLAVLSTDAPKQRKRGLSSMWGRMLATLNSKPMFSYKDIRDAAELYGYDIAANVARSQMKLYVDSGLVERIEGGQFRVTADGLAAARTAIERALMAPGEADAIDSPDDETAPTVSSSKPQPAVRGDRGKEDS